MSWLVVLFGLVLAGGGVAALYASIDLQTTMVGLVYATCGAVGVSGGVIVVALGLMMRKLDALRRVLPRAIESAIAAARAAPVVPPPGLEPAAAAEASEALPRVAPSVEPPPMTGSADDEISNGGNFAARAAKAPQPPERDPPAPPTLVGRYAAGGANYSLYSDGSIEAETDQGAFKFDSMNEFKAYIAAKRG